MKFSKVVGYCLVVAFLAYTSIVFSKTAPPPDDPSFLPENDEPIQVPIPNIFKCDPSHHELERKNIDKFDVNDVKWKKKTPLNYSPVEYDFPYPCNQEWVAGKCYVMETKVLFGEEPTIDEDGAKTYPMKYRFCQTPIGAYMAVDLPVNVTTKNILDEDVESVEIIYGFVDFPNSVCGE